MNERETLNHGALEYVTGKLSVSGVDAIDLPALKEVGGNFDVIFSADTFTSLSAPSLKVIGGRFHGTDISGAPFTNVLCKSLDFPRLASVGGDFAVEGLSGMTNFSAAELVNASGIVRVRGAALRDVYLNRLDKFVAIDVKGGEGKSAVRVRVPCVSGGLGGRGSHSSNDIYGAAGFPVEEVFPAGCVHTSSLVATPPASTNPPPASGPTSGPAVDVGPDQAVSSDGADATRVPHLALTLSLAIVAAAASFA